MKLYGWQSLWIVISLLLGIGFGYYTVKMVPEVPKYIKLDWIKSVSEVLAEGKLDSSNQPMTVRQVYNGLYNTYKSPDGIIASFEEMATAKPRDKAEKREIKEIASLNQLYTEKLADPNKNNTLYMTMIIVWLLASTALYILGNLIGGVLQRFRK